MSVSPAFWRAMEDGINGGDEHERGGVAAYRGLAGRRSGRSAGACCGAANLGNFMRTLGMPKVAEPWSLTSLREKLIKIGARSSAMAVRSRSDGRGGGVATDVRRHPVADRPAAGATHAGMRRRRESKSTERRGERYAPDSKAARVSVGGTSVADFDRPFLAVKAICRGPSRSKVRPGP